MKAADKFFEEHTMNFTELEEIFELEEKKTRLTKKITGIEN